jgi:hypothetical protein
MGIDTLLAVLVLAGASAAQLVPVAPLDIRGLQLFPGRGNAGATDLTRLTFGKGADGEALMEVSASWFQGMGDRSEGSTVVCSIEGVTVPLQDHNASTAESYGIVIRPRAGTGGPDMAATPILQLNNLSAPTIVSGGVRGWAIQSMFMSNSKPDPKPIPCQQTFYFGVFVPKDNNWPKDGISLFMSRYPETSGPATDRGDFARVWHGSGDPVTNLLWSVVVGNPPTNRPQDLGFRGGSLPFSLIASGPVLQAGAGHLFNGKTHPGFGAAGIFPDIARSPTGDGLVLRITDNANRTTGGAVLLFGALATTGGPPVLPGLKGRVYLSPGLFFLVGGALTKDSADTLLELAPKGKIPTSLVGLTLYFQAATQGTSPASAAAITNLVGVSYF